MARLARPGSNVTGAHAWELAHEALARQFGAAAATDIYIEPDFEQQWLPENPLTTRQAGIAAAADCVFNDQNKKLPGVAGEFAWHLGDAYSQLKSAREAAAGGSIVRIAHLDTGFDPNHIVVPPNLRADLQRNFMDDQAGNDAHDPGKTGFLKNPGHGTGTLSILAGGKFKFQGAGYPQGFNDFIGGAPNAEIIPVRVGKSVVQLFTSNIAAGINYAAELCSQENTWVHVMSMSMGGVASQAWADAVNKAYEAGIVYVCAAGNNFSAGLFGLPTRFIVYPARFRRVIAACGVMATQPLITACRSARCRVTGGRPVKWRPRFRHTRPISRGRNSAAETLWTWTAKARPPQLPRSPLLLHCICKNTVRTFSIPLNTPNRGCGLKRCATRCFPARANPLTAAARKSSAMGCCKQRVRSMSRRQMQPHCNPHLRTARHFRFCAY